MLLTWVITLCSVLSGRFEGHSHGLFQRTPGIYYFRVQPYLFLETRLGQLPIFISDAPQVRWAELVLRRCLMAGPMAGLAILRPGG